MAESLLKRLGATEPRRGDDGTAIRSQGIRTLCRRQRVLLKELFGLSAGGGAQTTLVSVGAKPPTLTVSNVVLRICLRQILFSYNCLRQL